MLLVGWQEGHPACKKTEWWDAGMVICLGQGADLHMAQLMPLHWLSLAPVNPDRFYLPGFTFMVLAHPGSPGQNLESHKTVVVVVVNVIADLVSCHVLDSIHNVHGQMVVEGKDQSQFYRNNENSTTIFPLVIYRTTDV